MPTQADLIGLRERVLAATGPDRQLDGLIMFHLFAVPVGNDVGYLWPEDNPSWNFGLTRDNPVSQKTKDSSARDARRDGVAPKEWIEFQRGDGRWVLMNDLRIPKLTGLTDAAISLVDRVLPGQYVNIQPWFYIDGERVTYRVTLVCPRWADYTPRDDWFDNHEAEHGDRCLAILAALLTAKLALLDKDQTHAE